MSDFMLPSRENNPIQQKHVLIGNKCKLTLADVNLLAHYSVPVKLSPASYTAMEKSHHFLKSCIDEGLTVYGINTSFGDQVNLVDSLQINQSAYEENIQSRQTNIIQSLACSLGAIVPKEIVQVTMMLRAHCLAQGYSGITPALAEHILAFLNAGIIPIVHCYGSIGASGDLIPLSMIATAMIGGKVDVYYRNEIIPAAVALEKAGLKKITPHLRDGLAMINGTSFMTAIASLSLYRLQRLFKQMLTAIAMSLESMLVISSAYHPLVHQLKHQLGEQTVNQFFLDFWQGSQLLSDLDELRQKPLTKKTVQDYYSLRSVPQGFGPFQENLERAEHWIENEMNSVNDNPIIDAAAKQIYHGANFMGYYVTDACDLLKMNIAQASTWLHALLANMVHPRKNQGLPANIVNNPNKNNGFRSMQLLAAALAVQNRKLAQAHQSYTLPTEGDNQDVNSLGTHAALDFKEAVDNLERLTAILLLAATQALELRGITKASSRAQKIYKIIRDHSPTLEACRPMTADLVSIIDLLTHAKMC